MIDFQVWNEDLSFDLAKKKTIDYEDSIFVFPIEFFQVVGKKKNVFQESFSGPIFLRCSSYLLGVGGWERKKSAMIDRLLNGARKTQKSFFRCCGYYFFSFPKRPKCGAFPPLHENMRIFWSVRSKKALFLCIIRAWRIFFAQSFYTK